VFRTIVWCRAGIVTEGEADMIAGKALVHATSEWIMRHAPDKKPKLAEEGISDEM
jgi:hypothetical protein